MKSARARVVGGTHPVKEAAGLVDAEGKINDGATLEMLRQVLSELAEAVFPIDLVGVLCWVEEARVSGLRLPSSSRREWANLSGRNFSIMSYGGCYPRHRE